MALLKLHKRTKRRKILDNRKAGERNEAEEEGLRSAAAMDQILVRLAKNSHLYESTKVDDDDDDEYPNHKHKDTTVAVAEPLDDNDNSNKLPTILSRESSKR